VKRVEQFPLFPRFPFLFAFFTPKFRTIPKYRINRENRRSSDITYFLLPGHVPGKKRRHVKPTLSNLVFDVGAESAFSMVSIAWNIDCLVLRKVRVCSERKGDKDR